jgi:MFS family permease
MRSHWARVNGPLLGLIAEGFLSRLSFGVISFALPLYAHHLGLSLAEIGFLASLNIAVALATKPAMGWVADHAGVKRSYVAAIALRSVVALLLALATAPWQLYAIRSVLGVSQALRDPSADALIAGHGGKKAIASVFAWYATAKNVAGSLGAAAAGVLLALTARDFPLVFGLAFVLSLLPVYIVLRYVREGSEQRGTARRSGPAAPSRALVRDDAQAIPVAEARPALPAFVGLGMLVSGTAQMLRGLLPILMTDYAGMSEAQAGFAYLASSAVVLGSGPLFGWLADHVSQHLVLAVRSVANTVSSIIFLLAPNPPGFIAGLVVDDVGKSAFRPAWGALMARVASLNPRRRAQTMAWMSWGEDVGEVLGPILTGFIWGAWGIGAVLGVRILLALSTEAYAAVLVRGLGRPRRPQVQDVHLHGRLAEPPVLAAEFRRPVDALHGGRSEDQDRTPTAIPIPTGKVASDAF